MTNFDKHLQQELINLLIKLKNQASPSIAKHLADNIQVLETQADFEDPAKSQQQKLLEVCYYLVLLTGHYPSLMSDNNADLYKKFQENIHLKNNLANHKKTR